MAAVNLNVTAQSIPSIKIRPKWDRFVFDYAPSKDGVDENLLILLHGFGDTHLPFAKLGRSLSLPQTATLAIQAPELIPFLLDEDPPGYQWYPTYSPLGELLTNPNPSNLLTSLHSFLNHLVDECHWPPERIHLFGFAQGGSAAAELALKYWRTQPQGSNSETETEKRKLGSVATISGPLLSYPTGEPCPTPLLIVHRPGTEQSALSKADLAALRKGFGGRVVEEKLGKQREGMPTNTNRDEWMPIMKFWSDVLERRVTGECVYRVG